ncbi:MAG TPA: carboxypeptidase-like regulatory domain-containing protein, partial [Verrucomicrobiae bacterium]|nr:carboxypeptidase-like regulatory domain-containing protein [Verrucomicrobiae bacterium]
FADNLFCQLLACPTNARTMNISLGVANGKWETAIALENSGPGGTRSFSSPTEGDWNAAYNAVPGKNGDVAVSCSYMENGDWATRMVYVKDDGQTVPIPGNSWNVNNLAGATLVISSNEFAQIREFRLQRRKYAWVKFNDVSLQLGQPAVVTINDAPGYAAAASATNEAPAFSAPLHHSFSPRLWLDLATGKIARLPQSVSASDRTNGLDYPRTIAWAKSEGVQLAMDPDTNNPVAFICIGAKIIRLERDDYRDMTAAELIDELRHDEPLRETFADSRLSDDRYVPFGSRNLPAVFGFETEAGAKGILEITGYSTSPRRINVSYKLAQPPVTTANVANNPATGKEPSLRVTGTVTDAATGKPIAGARVDDNSYAAGPTRAPQQAWTDADGNFALKTWPEEHTIAASAPGYQTKLATLITPLFRRERERRMNFRLQPVADAVPQPISAAVTFGPSNSMEAERIHIVLKTNDVIKSPSTEN